MVTQTVDVATPGPAHRLWPVIAGDDVVADADLLHRDEATGGADRRAGGKAGSGQ